VHPSDKDSIGLVIWPPGLRLQQRPVVFNRTSEATGQFSGPTLHASALLVGKGAVLLFSCHYGFLKAGENIEIFEVKLHKQRDWLTGPWPGSGRLSEPDLPW